MTKWPSDTQSCVSGQENRKLGTAHKCVIYTKHDLAYCSFKTIGSILSNLYIFVRPYTQPYIPNLKEITPVVSEI